MKITIPAFSDYHVHLRQGRLLEKVAKYSSRQCARILVMPNIDPPVQDGRTLIAYREELKQHVEDDCEILMVMKLLERTTEADLRSAKEAGCVAVKIYPAGVTTNSNDGISRHLLDALNEIAFPGNLDEAQKRFIHNLREIEDLGMVLCLHGELPGEEVLQREVAFLNYVKKIRDKFSRLKIVLEHITTKEAVKFIEGMNYYTTGQIAATITPHHLMNTLTDLLGSELRPHLYCKPVLKNKADRLALRTAAKSGKPYFFLGSDSAPHFHWEKTCDHGCAGVFNAPYLAECLVEIFEDMSPDYLPELIKFTSISGDDFYGLPHTQRTITLQKNTSNDKSMVHNHWRIPASLQDNCLVPYRAGERLQWLMVEGKEKG